MTRPDTRGPASTRPAARRPAPRRVSAEHYRRRRLAAALVALLLLVGLGLTARVLLYDAGLADVEDVRVVGTAAVPVEDVLAAAAVATGGPLAEVDPDRIAARVAPVPGIERVVVGRDWPHTVTIEVIERVAVATVPTPDGPALVDRNGVVYQGGQPVTGLPRLRTGVVGAGDPSTLAAVAVLAALPEPVRAQVLAVDVTVATPGAPPQVALQLTEDRWIRWGAPERAGDKAAVVVPLLTEPGHVYDVTSPDLPTVRR